MAQINLLKQPSPSTNLLAFLPKLLVQVLVVVFFLLLIYYGWLSLESKRIDDQIITLQTKINTDKATAFNTPRRNEVLTRQQQLKSLNGLIASHIYFSQIMPLLANSTLKRSAYSSLKVALDGQLVLSVNVPTLEDMDKYLQVFDLPKVNKYFSQVRVTSFHKVQNKDVTSINFQVTMKFDPSIINYNSPTTALNTSN